jgi:hypothetical protein
MAADLAARVAYETQLTAVADQRIAGIPDVSRSHATLIHARIVPGAEAESTTALSDEGRIVSAETRADVAHQPVLTARWLEQVARRTCGAFGHTLVGDAHEPAPHLARDDCTTGLAELRRIVTTRSGSGIAEESGLASI